MVVSPVEPLAEIRVPPLVAALPKADLHIHAEADARIERVLARRAGREPYDWRNWAARLLVETSPGMGRLVGMAANRCAESRSTDPSARIGVTIAERTRPSRGAPAMGQG